MVLTASGGVGDYRWTVLEGSPQVGTGSSFTTKFSYTGNFRVALHSGSQTVYCNINTVSTPPPPPLPPPLVCPLGAVSISPTLIYINDFSTASAPSGWTGGGFSSSNGAVANIIDGTRGTSVKGFAVGSASISGQGWTAPSGAVNCPLSPAVITVRQHTTNPPAELVCSPSNQNTSINQNAAFSVLGGTGVYSWSAPQANPTSGSGSNFAAKYSSPGSKAVTVTSGSQSRVCNVYVNEPPAAGQPNLVITKLVKNLGSSQTTGFGSAINAKLNDIVQYEIVVSNNGNEDASAVVVSDSSIINSNATNFSVSRAYQGSLLSGIHLGTLAQGASVTIRYSARVTIEQGEIRNIASISANNASSKQAIAIVNVAKDIPPANTTGGNCNNSNNSCNTNTNTSTGTNTNSNNSSNQSNQTNINGNNNTLTNTNQNCVNNSCNNTNIVYISTTGSTVPGNDYRQLAITKLVRNLNGGAFTNSVSLNNNEIVEFEVVVRNTGNQVVNNAQMTDT